VPGIGCGGGALAELAALADGAGAPLGDLALLKGEPDAAWFARILAGAAPPKGVRANPSPGSWSVTLCTFIANLTTGETVLLGMGAEAVRIPLTGLAQGRAGAPQAGASRS
jgi:hypothetical protein